MMKDKIVSLKGSKSIDYERSESMEAKYFLLYNKSPDMHISVDPVTACIQECNQTLLDKLGYTKKEVIGKPVFSLYHPNSFEMAKDAFKIFTKVGKIVNYELSVIAKNGSKVSVLLNVEAIRDADGNILSSNSTWRDITEINALKQEVAEINKTLEQKVAERTFELTQSNKELEQFAYIASHDLQEPLQTLTSFTEFLVGNYGDSFDETGKKSIEFIAGATSRMSKLINGLLYFSRIGRNGKKGIVDCNQLINDIRNDLLTTIINSNTTIEVEKLPVLFGYDSELKLLFRNIITNAIKFCKSNIAPVIKIRVQKQKKHWLFSIADNGIGIAEDHKDRIFTIFQQLHLRNEYEGTGIGLAYCQKIVNLHGGTIWVDSEINIGSTFHFTIQAK